MSKIISVPVSHMYAAPSADSEHTDEVLFGTSVTVTESFMGFSKVVTAYGYSGWIKETDTAEMLAEPNRIVVSPWADLLRNDENRFAPVMTLPMGALVDAGFSPQFPHHAFVVLPDKRTFYIRREHLGEIPSGVMGDAARKVITDAAESFLGTQYRWGGRTHNGVDCSGLVFTSYAMAGITVWRDADPDKTPGLVRIKLSEAKPADMLFFPGHIGMYLGDGMFIHSTSSAARTVYASLDSASPLYNKWCADNLICVGSVPEPVS